MSEPKLITPLLANHIMGEPISEHHGVRCCPAMLKDTDNKYIVKIISIPASQVQLDALLLTGAYPSREDALRYFKELADATVEEARLLQKLSRLEGFQDYPSWQVEPMEDGTGYDVYLLGEYGLTLDRYLRRNALTHLQAVNLGLDLCAALSVCRRNGYLYVDLKPENIFFSDSNEYRIGDLGFISLSSLKYASLPDKYRSAYTAPEITDAYSALNTTLDVYAVGLILYQAFNDGKLPETGTEPASPAYADYEMAEIILKACALNPEDRWEDPMQMGQALVSYMQRNSVNDTPIIPVPEPEPTEPEEVEEEGVEEVLPEENLESEVPQNGAEEIPVVEENISDESEETDAVEEEADSESEEFPAVEDGSGPDEDPGDLDQFIIDGFEHDETAPAEEDTADLDTDALSDEMGEILAQADDLIAHTPPEPVVAPEPVEIPMPDPILPEQEPESGEADTEQAQADTEEVTQVAEDETAEETEPADAPAPKKKLRGLIGALIAVLILLLLAVGAFYYYENYYLQHIYGIDVTSREDQLTVALNTEIDNSLLTVYLTDTYGNTLPQSVADNKAHFENLHSGTSYKVTVEIEGFHKLVGSTTASHTTDTETNIVTFTAIAADTDGSVILNFSVQGPDNTNWYVKYSADGEAEQTALCTGHMATITGLDVGSIYTFRLVPEADLYVVGNQTLEYTALPVIYAENLAIRGFDSGRLMVTWDAHESIAVESWTVRCYNETFDITFTVTENQALIEVPDVSQSYTVDVKAEGMTVSKWTSVSANSITFKDIAFDDSKAGEVTVTWDYEGTAPADGWMLMYAVDGSEKYIVKTQTNSCVISPLIPGGNYSVSFVLSDDITVFGGSASYTAPVAESFSAYGVKASQFTFNMCPTPEDVGWIWWDMWSGYYTNTLITGQKASFVISVDGTIEKSADEIPTLFVIKNADGVPISVTEGRCRKWNDMWRQNHTELDMPYTPTTPGAYTVDIYFSGQFVASISFSITAQPLAES